MKQLTSIKSQVRPKGSVYIRLAMTRKINYDNPDISFSRFTRSTNLKRMTYQTRAILTI